MENTRLDQKQREAKSTESPQEDIWTSAFDRKDGANLADPPPLQLEATHSGTGDEAYQRILRVLGIDPDGTGLPNGELQLLAAMLQRLPIDGVTKARDDGSMEVRLQQDDATLSLHITQGPDGGQPSAEIDFRHGKHVLRRRVEAGPSATEGHEVEGGQLEDGGTESGTVQIVGIGDDGYIEGKGGISVSEEYLEEFTHTKPIGQEGGVGLSDPHIGYSRKVQVTAEDGRMIYLKVNARAAKQAGSSSITSAPNEASFELLVTRPDGQQGYVNGSFADIGGTMTMPEMLAALAEANNIPAALLSQGQLGEPFIDGALSKANEVLAPLPQSEHEGAGRLNRPEELTRTGQKVPWEQMTPDQRRQEAMKVFKKEFSWVTVLELVAISVAAVVALAALGEFAPAVGAVALALVSLAAVGYGVWTIVAPYLEGESAGWTDWLKGGLLILGGSVGLAALALGGMEAAGAIMSIGIAVAIGYAIVEGISAYIEFEEGVAAPTREEMEEKVKKSAHEAEHAIADGISAAIPVKQIQKLVSKLKPSKPGAPGEEFLPTEEENPRAFEEETAPHDSENTTQVPIGGKNPLGLPAIERQSIAFRPNSKHDAAEFARQLQSQEDGLNRLTVEEYLNNRDRYLREGRAPEGGKAQQSFRQKELQRKIDELIEANPEMTDEEATSIASKWLEGQAALHDPDQVAGGNPENITGLGDKTVNSSLGSQWSKRPPGGTKSRAELLDDHVRSISNSMAPEERQSTFLNVKLDF